MSKKPDIIVWDEERGWYASKLTYGSNVGAPAIRPDDVAGWKLANVKRANDYFQTRFDDIKKEYERLIQEYRWTELVYKAKYNFEPVIGKTYYLYYDGDDAFLSLISPNEWRTHPEYIGTFRMDAEHKWEKCDL
jgi:Protein of unknown function (DUF2452)